MNTGVGVFYLASALTFVSTIDHFRSARTQSIIEVGQKLNIQRPHKRCEALFAWSLDDQISGVNQSIDRLLSESKHSEISNCLCSDRFGSQYAARTEMNGASEDIKEFETTNPIKPSNKPQVKLLLSPSWLTLSIPSGKYTCKKSICQVSDNLRVLSPLSEWNQAEVVAAVQVNGLFTKLQMNVSECPGWQSLQVRKPK